jgi:nucleotide-binding universal stress UspA family protein
MTKQTIRRILFYADEMPPDEKALAYLVEVASYLEASVTVVSVVRPIPQQVFVSRTDLAFDEIRQLMVEDRKRELEEAVTGLGDVRIGVEVRVLVGNPAAAIIRAVMHDGYDLVIKTRVPGSALRRGLFGSTDVRLMRA